VATSPRPRARGPRPGIDTDRIACAAIRLADEGGLRAVTFRRLGAELGVSPSALYRYVRGKEELTALMIEAAIGPSPDLASLPGDWRRKLAAYARQVARTWPPHPWLPGPGAGCRTIGPNEASWLEAPLRILADTGLSGPERLDAVRLVAGHVRSAHSAELSGTHPSDACLNMRSLMRTRLGSYPALARALAESTGAAASARRQSYGLDRIFAGLTEAIADRAVGRVTTHR
jgi:AcrR family transcriptional regulator